MPLRRIDSMIAAGLLERLVDDQVADRAKRGVADVAGSGWAGPSGSASDGA